MDNMNIPQWSEELGYKEDGCLCQSMQVATPPTLQKKSSKEQKNTSAAKTRCEVFAEGGQVAEEDFMEEEEVEEQKMEVEGREVKKGSAEWKVAQVHQRLGHPTRATLVRMLSLAGAPKHVIETAENYKCPTCEAVTAPGRYQSRTRSPDQ